MDRRFAAPYFITLLFVPVAAGLRLWSLVSAVDNQGLPVMDLSVWCLIGAAAVFLLIALICSLRSPGRSGKYAVLDYGRAGLLCGMASAVLVLLGTAVEFSEALTGGPKLTDAILVLLGVLGGACLAVAAWTRSRHGAPHPGAEVLPVAYLLVKLILNFKEWSTDPMILDYCFTLFALIFTLLATFRGAGFVFDQGKPRRTLLCAMAAVFFCAAAIMDGIVDLSLGATILYGGYLLWQLPMLWDLLAPSEPDPKPESPEQTS